MAYHGKNGHAEIGDNDLVHLQNWSASASCESEESTSMGSSWQTHLAGFRDFTASAEGLSKKGLNTVAILGSDAELDLVFDSDNGPHLTGNAICTSITENCPYDGNATISYSFECNDTDGLEFSSAGGSAAPAVDDPFKGKSCKVSKVAEDVSGCRGWSITLDCSTEQSTAAGQDAHTREAGFKGATATVTLLASNSAEFVEGTSYDLRLHRTGTASDGIYALATPAEGALCTGADPGLNSNGVGVVTYSFVYSGAVELKTS